MTAVDLARPLELRTAVRVLDARDAPAAAALLARGFAQEPGGVALLRDPVTRDLLLRSSAAEELRSVLPLGTVHGVVVDGSLAAIAVWHPPGVAPTSLPTRVRKVAAALPHARRLAAAAPTIAVTVLGNARSGRALQRERARAVAEASRGTSWHLAMLATAPEHRGHGLARRLLGRQLDRCDEDGTAAWLETTEPVNPPIYERFGFRTVTHVPDAAWLPGYWVMRREPEAR